MRLNDIIENYMNSQKFIELCEPCSYCQDPACFHPGDLCDPYEDYYYGEEDPYDDDFHYWGESWTHPNDKHLG